MSGAATTRRTASTSVEDLQFFGDHIAPECRMCVIEDHDACISAYEFGSLDVCGCYCHA